MIVAALRFICILACCLGLPACSDPHPDAGGDLIIRATTDKPFADVVEELEFAITERNFRITGSNKIGSGLRDRGYKDFPDVEVIHFCSLENAREVLMIDPGYVAMMPCRVTVHVQHGETVVSMVLLPENHPDPRVREFAARMNATLREILAFALEDNARQAP
jgi:uncharacterized protein (DUF302 family)